MRSTFALYWDWARSSYPLSRCPILNIQTLIRDFFFEYFFLLKVVTLYTGFLIGILAFVFFLVTNPGIQSLIALRKVSGGISISTSISLSSTLSFLESFMDNLLTPSSISNRVSFVITTTIFFSEHYISMWVLFSWVFRWALTSYLFTFLSATF